MEIDVNKLIRDKRFLTLVGFLLAGALLYIFGIEVSEETRAAWNAWLEGVGQ